ncbi:MAG: CBS domain-containing protein [Anaerolineaceae bacterium]|nr:CBS domain-containing protein [Anaerolineaceae bacterium]
MATVRQILNEKGNDVYSVNPDMQVINVLRVLADKGIGAVLIMEGEKVVGIFSERDYALQSAKGNLEKQDMVSKWMTRGVFYVSPNDLLETCMAQMTDKHIRHLPVVDEGKVVGIISIGDVVKSIIMQQKITIEGLENYILGSGLRS